MNVAALNNPFVLYIAAGVGGVLLMLLFRNILGGSSREDDDNLRAMMDFYREDTSQGMMEDPLAFPEGEPLGALDEARETSLDKRLRYAQLEKVPPYMISVVQIAISLAAFFVARIFLREVLQIASLTLGPLIVNKMIERRIEARTRRFDQDFPQFLLAVTGMLKTGLNTAQALEAAAGGLEEDSLVRQEVELMLERFRVGVPEDRSMGSFGEDIRQPEIELFVQALILSKRVGGNLSDTLDRLSKQVRKRQSFKRSASSSVAQSRGSIWVIIGLIVALQGFMLLTSPQMVLGAWQTPSLAGWAQGSLVVIAFGVWLMNKITNIRI
jgi:tight adherence protein B